MPSLTYTTNIPNPTNSPSTDVPNMQTNTNSINTIWQADHFTFADSNPGTHKQVTLTVEAAPSLPAGTGGAMYASTINGNAWPVWVNALGSTAMLSSISQPTSNGYTSLPGQIIVQWGTTTASGTGTRNVLFATSNIDFPNNCFQVFAQTQITTITNAIAWSVSNISKTGFSLGTNPLSTPSGTSFSWFAIGN